MRFLAACGRPQATLQRIAPAGPSRRSVGRTAFSQRSCARSVRMLAQGGAVGTKPPPAITLTEAAQRHLQRLKQDQGRAQLLLRMGVKTGGCSGMSYDMTFEEESNIAPADMLIEYDDGIKVVCDSKSLLYLFGMELDWSDALMGGGFKFQNPNANKSCSCGKSFGV